MGNLERLSHWYTPTEDVEANIMLCMEAEGWRRAVYEGYIVILG